MSRIGRWLREPVKAHTSDDEVDWDAFNRSVGRTIGGHNESFNEQPKRLPPATGGSFDEPIDTPRWVVLVAVVLGLAISLGFIAMVFWLGSR